MATQKEAKTLRIGGGEGYGYSAYKVGQVVKIDKTRPGYAKCPEYLYVLEAESKYYRHDGMSFGVGDESGYVYWAVCREATAEESAPLRSQAAEGQKKNEAQKAVNVIVAEIQKNGECPREDELIVLAGEILLDTSNIYGGGSCFVFAEDYIWYVRNNGGDGDDWGHNNIRTGGAGAIGWRIPKNEIIVAALTTQAGIIEG